MNKTINEVAHVSNIGTKIRVKLPDGSRHSFDGYMEAIQFLNKRKLVADSSQIPDFFRSYLINYSAN